MAKKTESFVVKSNAPALAAYPHARRAGSLLFVSGTSSRRPDHTHEGVVILEDGRVEKDIRKQTRAVIHNIREILRAAGAGLEDLVDLTVYLKDMSDYAAYNETYNEFFEVETGPTRTTIGVAELPHPHLLIEIKAVAYLPKKKETKKRTGC